jgi:hypothetical protein
MRITLRDRCCAPFLCQCRFFRAKLRHELFEQAEEAMYCVPKH